MKVQSNIPRGETVNSLITKVAEVHGNRTHRAHLPVNPTGFEVQASHQARFTSARAAGPWVCAEGPVCR